VCVFACVCAFIFIILYIIFAPLITPITSQIPPHYSANATATSRCRRCRCTSQPWYKCEVRCTLRAVISPHPRTPTSVAPSQATSRSHSRAAASSSNSALLLPQSLLAHRQDLQYPHRLSPGTNELLAQPTIFVYSRDRERAARRPPPPAPPRRAHTPCASSGCSPQTSARQPAGGARSTGAHSALCAPQERAARCRHPATPAAESLQQHAPRAEPEQEVLHWRGALPRPARVRGEVVFARAAHSAQIGGPARRSTFPQRRPADPPRC